MTVDYETGSGLTVSVNGTVTGGVLRLRRWYRQTQTEIMEFLTDQPVAVIPSRVYLIEMELCRADSFPFDGTVESVTVSGFGRTETYTLCTVENTESRAVGRDKVIYTVRITARERSVDDE